MYLKIKSYGECNAKRGTGIKDDFSRDDFRDVTKGATKESERLLRMLNCSLKETGRRVAYMRFRSAFIEYSSAETEETLFRCRFVP